MHKDITIKLIGMDGNSFSIIARVQREMRRAGKSDDQISEIVDDMMSDDYSHLLGVVMENFEVE